MANVVLDQPHLLDTMSFRLLLERTVPPQADIKVSVPITVLLAQGEDNATQLTVSVRGANRWPRV